MNKTNNFWIMVLRPLQKVQNELFATSSKSRVSEIRSLLVYIRSKSKNDNVSDILELMIFGCDVKMKSLFT